MVVASTVDKGGPLAPLANKAIEFVQIRTAQQYPTLMPTLFPGEFATKERPYDSLASTWTAFAILKYNTSPAIDGNEFASALSPRAHTLPLTRPLRLALFPRYNAITPGGLLRTMSRLFHLIIAETPSR